MPTKERIKRECKKNNCDPELVRKDKKLRDRMRGRCVLVLGQKDFFCWGEKICRKKRKKT